MIAAFDLSLTAAGWATSSGTSGVIASKTTGMARLREIRAAVLQIAEHADVVVIEGYSFGAKGNAILNLAELGGIVRVALVDRGQPYVEVPPSSLKLFATGKGNAPKDAVLVEAVKQLGYHGHDHNVADALWLLRLAECGLQLRSCTNEHQRRALAKLTWPGALAKAC